MASCPGFVSRLRTFTWGRILVAPRMNVRALLVHEGTVAPCARPPPALKGGSPCSPLREDLSSATTRVFSRHHIARGDTAPAQSDTHRAPADTMVPSIYQLKPAFQRLLRPTAGALFRLGVTANQVTLLAGVVSVLVGAVIAWFASHPWVFILVPIWMFLRMALGTVQICTRVASGSGVLPALK